MKSIGPLLQRFALKARLNWHKWFNRRMDIMQASDRLDSLLHNKAYDEALFFVQYQQALGHADFIAYLRNITWHSPGFSTHIERYAKWLATRNNELNNPVAIECPSLEKVSLLDWLTIHDKINSAFVSHARSVDIALKKEADDIRYQIAHNTKSVPFTQLPPGKNGGTWLALLFGYHVLIERIASPDHSTHGSNPSTLSILHRCILLFLGVSFFAASCILATQPDLTVAPWFKVLMGNMLLYLLFASIQALTTGTTIAHNLNIVHPTSWDHITSGNDICDQYFRYQLRCLDAHKDAKPCIPILTKFTPETASQLVKAIYQPKDTYNDSLSNDAVYNIRKLEACVASRETMASATTHALVEAFMPHTVTIKVPQHS